MNKKITLVTILSVCGLISFIYYGYCNVRPHLVFAGDMEQLQKSTIQTFKSLQVQMNAQSSEMLKMIYQDRIDRASEALRKNPNDVMAKEQFKIYSRKMADLESRNLNKEKQK